MMCLLLRTAAFLTNFKLVSLHLFLCDVIYGHFFIATRGVEESIQFLILVLPLDMF
jgi:hypothetical protein